MTREGVIQPFNWLWSHSKVICPLKVQRDWWCNKIWVCLTVAKSNCLAVVYREDLLSEVLNLNEKITCGIFNEVIESHGSACY